MNRINIRLSDEWKAFDRLIVILAIVLIILLILFWIINPKLLPFNCCEDQEPIAQVVAPEPVVEAPPVEVAPTPAPAPPPVPTEPAELGLSVADGRILVSGVVDSAETRQALISQVQTRFAGAEIVDQLRVDEEVISPSGQAGLNAFLGDLNADDRLSISWGSQNVRISGVVDSEERKSALAESLELNDFTQGLYANVDLINQLEVAEAGPSCAEILQAAQIEFSSGSAELTALGRAELTKLIPCLQADSYTIIGHTDSDGAEELNRTLSLARADATLAYLTTQGFSADKFSTDGMGEGDPIADNGTAEGKSRNRRIEFRAGE